MNSSGFTEDELLALDTVSIALVQLARRTCCDRVEMDVRPDGRVAFSGVRGPNLVWKARADLLLGSEELSPSGTIRSFPFLEVT